jgi:ABC-2 type transport system ATP-binding protein
MSDKPRRVFIETPDPRRLASDLLSIEGVVGIELEPDRLTLQITDARGFALGLPSVLMSGGHETSRIEPTDESLESVFRYLVEGS